MKKELSFIDLFAGGGGLSEGFVQAGFRPIAHVESDLAACFTLKTRAVYRQLMQEKRGDLYAEYLEGKIDRNTFYRQVPPRVTESVINAEIGAATLSDIFRRIDDVSKNRRPDLIIGGPPCQGYSIVGRSCNKKLATENKRNELYTYYAAFLQRYRPRYFLLENVAGLLSAKNKNNESYLEAMQNIFRQHGYETDYKILSAENYGALQRRKRLILIGKREATFKDWPEPERWHPDVKVEEVFKDLPAISAGEGSPGPCQVQAYRGTWQIDANIHHENLPVTWHQARPHTTQDREIYKTVVELWNKQRIRLNYNKLPDKLKTHHNRHSFTDRFKVVAADLPYSHTVVAHIAKDGHYYIHPDIQQNRSITPREAARLQTFPDDYYFESTNGIPRRTPAFCQIGNAVPVLLARKVAEKLKEVWS